MRILGVDPGLQRTGYGVIDYTPAATQLVEGGIIPTDPQASLESRLAAIAADIRAILRELHPEAMVVEQLYAKYRHPQTAMLMGHARGVVLLAAAEFGIAVAAYPASQVKRALVGHGRASKEQVAAMVTRMLGLAEVPQPDDVTDALALCLCHTSPLRLGPGSGELPARIAEALRAHVPCRQGVRKR